MYSYGFPAQLDKSRQECDELSHQLKLQQRETERVRQESALDIEKVITYYQVFILLGRVSSTTIDRLHESHGFS